MAKRFNLAEYVKAEAVSDSDHPEITMIPVERIRKNPRNFYEAADVADLADSIELNGLMDPLVVYKGDGILYTILSGHRRYSAITELRQRDGCGHMFDEVPCVVRARPSSTAMEDILLIQANSTGRIRTPRDMATEAERLTAALVKLKKDGAELPGRMRDAVADAMGVSSTKLARMNAIKNHLKVSGFRGAYDRQDLSEAAAYEISQMNEGDQYDLLDRAIDAGLDYEKLDVKSVQKLRRQIEAGESTKQDMYIEAEKRGIRIQGEDFSPLLAALVAEAIPSWERWDVLECRTKAAGVALLHQFGLTHHSSSGGAIWFDSDPQALTLKRPICKRIKWPEVWELLALDAMQRQAIEAPAEDEKKPALVKLKVAAETPHPPAEPAPSPQGEGCSPEGWHKCSTDTPPEGQLVTVMFDDGDGCEDWFAHVAVFKGGRYVEFGWETVVVDIIPGAVWAPLPGGWKEAAK